MKYISLEFYIFQAAIHFATYEMNSMQFAYKDDR